MLWVLFVMFLFRRNGVVTAFAPWVATKYAFESKVSTCENAMNF